MTEKKISDASYVNVQDGSPEALRLMMGPLRAQVAHLDAQVQAAERLHDEVERLKAELVAARGARKWAPASLVAWAKEMVRIHPMAQDDFPLLKAGFRGVIGEVEHKEWVTLGEVREWIKEFP